MRITITNVCVILLLQIAGKQAGYRAMAEYYQSLVCKNNKSIGEEIARVEVCLSRFFVTILRLQRYFYDNMFLACRRAV